MILQKTNFIFFYFGAQKIRFEKMARPRSLNIAPFFLTHSIALKNIAPFFLTHSIALKFSSSQFSFRSKELIDGALIEFSLPRCSSGWLIIYEITVHSLLAVMNTDFGIYEADFDKFKLIISFVFLSNTILCKRSLRR